MALGVICRGDLHERLNFMFRLHLPPALLPSDLEDEDSLDEDRVDSCSEVDDSEEVDGSDENQRFENGTHMDPLGAGVVVTQGTVTRQKSCESDRSRRDSLNHSDNASGKDNFTSSSEYSTSRCENMADVWDGCFVDGENADFDLINRSEVLDVKSVEDDGDVGEDESTPEDTRGKQGTYQDLKLEGERTDESEQCTFGENLNDDVDGNGGYMNQVRQT